MHDHDLPPDDDEQREMDPASEDASMQWDTSEDSNSKGSGSSKDNREDASMQHGTNKGGNNKGSNLPLWNPKEDGL